MSSPGAEPRRALADRLTADGVLRSPRWRAAVEAVPREVFLGDAVFRLDGGAAPWTRVRRGDLSASEWLALSHTDQTWVTQVDGVNADEAPATVSGAPTSSSSLPSLVVGMLEDLDVHGGHRVLEVATGTGYSTALLCHRLGAGRVTSVEVDPAVAARAERALRRLGYRPRLLVHDGINGGDGAQRYDRIIATCSFRYLPQPWLFQVDSGSKILLTLSGWLRADAQVLLTVDGDGTARGTFLPVDRSFMLARSHQPPPTGPVVFPASGDDRTTDIGPDLLTTWTGRFVAQLAAPAAQSVRPSGEVLLWDVSTGSQAWVRSAPDGGWSVRQHGPVRLWDAVEEALTAWRKAKTPGISAFGMVATHGEQRVWLGSPDGPSWRLPV